MSKQTLSCLKLVRIQMSEGQLAIAFVVYKEHNL